MSQSNSRSHSKKKQKKDKKVKKEKQKKKQNKSSSRSSSKKQSKQRKKDKKDKKDKKGKQKKQRSRSRSKSKNRKRKSQHQQKQQRSQKKNYKNRSPEINNKNNNQQQERLAKIAMRQVKAKLLKYALLQQSDESSSQDKPVLPPKIPQKQIVQQKKIQQTVVKKKQSKWGKTSSTQQTFVAPVINVPIRQPQPNLSLDAGNSQDHLKLSEDKSIQIEDDGVQNHHEVLQTIQEQYVDPLDQYMMQIQQQAVPQMELSLKQKPNIITYDDIVANDIQKKKPEQIQQQQQNAQTFRKNFLQSIKNLQDRKAQQKKDQKGIVMQNNEQNKQTMQQLAMAQDVQLDYFAKQRKLAQRKQLGMVDHSKIVYEEVRFNLYRQADQVKNLDHAAVQKYRKQAGDIKVRGKNIPNPIFNWNFCGYSDKVLQIIQKRQYKKPFPIQAQCMPLLLSGRDVIGIAETGSGKTLAYLLPAIKHIQDQRKVQEGQGPISIILTPTRQLARQVHIQAKAFARPLGIRVIAVYGGQPVQNQLADFRQGAELVVCTPGRMIDILTLNKGKITNLRRVTFLVIDEADRMFDLGFQPQITRIIDNVRPVKQVALFSATFPKNVQNLVKTKLKGPVEVIVGSRGQACANVQQIVEVRQQTTKLWRLLQILGIWNEKGSILIFVDKTTQADYLFQQLLKYGYSSLVLHGSMDPDDRQFTIYDFKRGVVNIMIATSVCARGLDIRSIVLVVNFKCPNHLEDYIHRIGRTGRGGNKGTAITFITPQQQQYSIDLLKALQMAQINPPQQLRKLGQVFLSKVKKGQARRIRNRNIKGQGYKFDEQQEDKVDQVRQMMKKQLKNQGLGGFSDSDDDDIQLKKKKEEVMRGRNHQERIAQAIKNPQIKSKLLNQAVKAVSDAIKNGSAIGTQKLLQIAVSSMRQSVTKYKAQDGLQTVTKLINNFANKSTTSQGADFFSYDFQINDYPLGARQKACNQGFLRGIQNQTNCSVSLRGVYVQPGKKAQIGCRKLYLHIQGENKYYVNQAYRQIKQVLQESAYEAMHMGQAPGKYAITM